MTTPTQPPLTADFLAPLRGKTPQQIDTFFKNLEKHRPETWEKLTLFFKQNPAAPLELRGYEAWLKALGPLTFTRPMAPIQRRFWEWNWLALMKVAAGQALEEREIVGFLPWSRSVGKSSHVEWAAIAEGAILKQGYVIIYSGKQSQAEEHVTAIRDRIESEHVAKMYPWLGSPKVGNHGNKFGWGKEFLMTKGGWAIRPVGADVAIRGGKVMNLRPTMIIIDDLDELGESPAVVEHKEQILTRSILPLGDANTRVLVPQNPIHENSVVNRMLMGVSAALAQRTIFGELDTDGTMSQRPIPAVRDFAYEIRHTDQGPHSEVTGGESNWPGITITDWERVLNRVGPPAFLSEYQHDMAISQEERVLPEYDDRHLMLHVISWDMFEKMFGMARIPSDWPCDVGLDIGYTGKHLSSWTFIARVPEGYPLAGSVFRYRGRNFTNVSIDDQAVAVRRDLWPGETLERQWMSHEKLGERMLLSGKHGWYFQSCDSSKESGWSAWRHYLRSDRSKAHPFHVDHRDENTGLWKLGRPGFFDVVVHKQLRNPIDDYGLKEHRMSSYTQRRRPVKLTESGLTVDQPVKMGDDPNDSSRMIFSSPTFGPGGKSMTAAQKVQAVIPEGYKAADLASRTDLHPNSKYMIGELTEFLAKRHLGQNRPRLVDEFGQELR